MIYKCYKNDKSNDQPILKVEMGVFPEIFKLTEKSVGMLNNAGIAEELKQYNVRTFCISPSSTQSKMSVDDKNQDYSTFLDPGDVAKYVLFAISHNSNIVSDEIFLKRMFIR